MMRYCLTTLKGAQIKITIDTTMNTIEVITLDADGYETQRRDFDTIKEAKAWVKEMGLDKAYWNRCGDSDDDYEGWAARNVYTLQLHKNEEIVKDWFPCFK